MTVMHAELTKFRSVPSTAWSLLSAVTLIVGSGVLYSMVRVTRPPEAGRYGNFTKFRS